MIATAVLVPALTLVVLVAYALIEFVAWREWRSVRDHERMRRALAERKRT